MTKARRGPDRSAGATSARGVGRAHRPTARSLSIKYAAGLAFAYVLAVADTLAILIPLNGKFAGATHGYFTPKNMVILALLFVAGIVAVAVGGVLNLRSTMRWFVRRQQPDAGQRRTATRLVRRQAMILSATWVVSAVVFLLLNLAVGLHLAVPALLAATLGGAAAASLSLLLTQDTLRPVLLAATQGEEGGVIAPRVITRLVLLWLLLSALPCATIAALVFFRSHGWIIQKTASVEMPVVVVTIAAVLLGLPTMVLTSRSIADPIREVVDAMARVERGRIDTSVGVYERSEIGRLQSGFNRMVGGIAERDRLRDLFGKHVGTDVARRAIEGGASLSGDVREAAILFIDLVGSTELADSRPPEEVAEVLNDFFQIVVGAVDDHNGLINKFQGDAALAVFGAPLASDGAASAALATARSLRSQLSKLHQVDFGIGVSAGAVFAGNIGAENRYEYTVVGDAVNEAARLADLAKTLDPRIVCSAAAVDQADAAEREHWISYQDTVLRGRTEATQIWIPADDN